MDPLNAYNYAYPNYNQFPENGYVYNVKLEQQSQLPIHNVYQPLMYPLQYPSNDKPAQADNEVPVDHDNQVNNIENQPAEEIDTKEHIQLIPERRRRVTKKKGKTSNYWNKKIEDKDFPFYGCTICNVNFTTITDLDQHVTIHKGRLTSYDIRIRNQMKRKQKIKELKRLKKLGKKLKKEAMIEIDIKPEDGYIGNEKASEFNSQNEHKESIGNDKPSESNSQNVPKGYICNDNASENKNNKTVQSENVANNEKVPSSLDTKNKDVKDKSLLKKNSEEEDPRLQKLFKCFACHKQFALSYYLKLHVRSHTDEKPYTCVQCGQSFITASKLGRHTKRIHLAIRFQCRICFRFFSRFDILVRHFDKAHKDDKLEGEPYDYNAILPYLKELEEQMKLEGTQDTKETGSSKDTEKETKIEGEKGTKIEGEKGTKIEGEKEMKKEIPETESVWDWTPDDDDVKDNVPVGYNQYLKDSTDGDEGCVEALPIEGVLVENVTVKLETADEEPAAGDCKREQADDCFSDEDYFPSNTWAATPKPEPEPPAKKKKKKMKKADFPAQCEFCDKVIKTPSYYVIHLRTHSGERPFKCYICDRGFITSSKMHRHVLTHPEHVEDGESKVKDEEGAEIKTEQDENRDTKKRKRKKKSSLPVSAKALTKEKGTIRSRKRPFACAFCGKKFMHQDTLQVHLKSHDGEKLVLKCSFCLEEQATEECLKAHEETHSGPKPYLCTVCGKSYTKRENMIYHRKTHDSDAKTPSSEYICDICSKRFNASCKLQRHIASHRAEKFILRYECPVCAHMFNTKYHAQMHLATHEKEGLILEENRSEILAMVMQNARKIPKSGDVTADVTFATSVDVTAAGDVTAGARRDERSRVCNICGQIFQHFYYLEEHLKSHGSKISIQDDSKEEEKKHICPICNKGFKLHYYLKLHSFTHTKEKPYICQTCGKGFITKGKLKRHLETHSGLKKYQCHICYKFFTRPSYLRIHVRTIHGTQDYNFRLDKRFADKEFVGHSF